MPGKRRAAKSSRPTLLATGLNSGPLLAGVAALAVASVGAVSTSGPADLVSADSQAPVVRDTDASGFRINAMSGVSKVTSTSLLDRGDVLSRDTDRDALEDAEGEVVEETETQARERNAALTALAQQAEQQQKELKLNAWVLPLSGYRLTATFGQSSGLWSRTHTGLDFAAPSGTPIVAVANGTVSETGYDGSYGNKTVLTLDDGTELWFCHQTSFAVSSGEAVAAGDVIGYVGSTGNSTGPHLHLEVRPGAGDPVDPYSALVAHGLTP